jgi:hypothetical protein
MKMSENENGEVVVTGTNETGETVVQTEGKTVRIRVDGETFGKTWETVVAELKAGKISGSGVKIVAERLGLQPTTVQQRATKYRKTYGVQLSNMPRGGGAKFNATAMNEKLAAFKATLNAEENGEENSDGSETETETVG